MPVIKSLPANGGDARDSGLIPGLRRSPGGGDGNPLRYSCLKNFMDRGSWWATVHRVTKSQTGLSSSHTHTHTHTHTHAIDILLAICHSQLLCQLAWFSLRISVPILAHCPSALCQHRLKTNKQKHTQDLLCVRHIATGLGKWKGLPSQMRTI